MLGTGEYSQVDNLKAEESLVMPNLGSAQLQRQEIHIVCISQSMKMVSLPKVEDWFLGDKSVLTYV